MNFNFSAAPVTETSKAGKAIVKFVEEFHENSQCQIGDITHRLGLIPKTGKVIDLDTSETDIDEENDIIVISAVYARRPEGITVTIFKA